MAARFAQRQTGFGLHDDEGSEPETAFVELSICDAAERAIRTARVSKVRGEEALALDGHALLMREKVAVLMSVLFGLDGTVEEWIWESAGFVMQVSTTLAQESKCSTTGASSSAVNVAWEWHKHAEPQTPKAPPWRRLEADSAAAQMPLTRREAPQEVSRQRKRAAGAVLADMVAAGAILCDGKHYRSSARA